MPDSALDPQPHHAAPDPRRTAVIALVVACIVLLAALAGGIALASGAFRGGAASAASTPQPPPPTTTALPVPERSEVPQATPALCEREDVQAALAAGDDGAVIAAAGGGEGFRRAVIEGSAPCVNLRDPARVWFVVNKTLPMDPIDYAPYDWVAPPGVPLGNLAAVRTDIAPSVQAMSDASVAAGAGTIGVQNGYRGYSVQQRIHDQRVAELGQVEGEKLAARPGYSEHQSGIAMDVFGCTPGCSSSEQFGSTPAFSWVQEHGWEFGWIVRYEEGMTDTTGYQPEAWHLRYIGPELATAYHEGGFRSLEDFFALPPAPAYPG